MVNYNIIPCNVALTYSIFNIAKKCTIDSFLFLLRCDNLCLHLWNLIRIAGFPVKIKRAQSYIDKMTCNRPNTRYTATYNTITSRFFMWEKHFIWKGEIWIYYIHMHMVENWRALFAPLPYKRDWTLHLPFSLF